MYRYTVNEENGKYSLKNCNDINWPNLINKLGMLEDLVEYLFDDPDLDFETIKLLIQANKGGIIRPLNPRKLSEGFAHHDCRVYFEQQLIEDSETGKELFLEDFGKLWGLDESDFKRKRRS